MNKVNRESRKKQDSQNIGGIIWGNFIMQIEPFLVRMGKVLEGRLMKTLCDLMQALLMHRERATGMVLTELGGYLAGEEHVPAGVKRIARLLHSTRWQASMIEEHFWQEADEREGELQHPQEEVLVIWDESVIEKPESIKSERLCAVRSSKAARLKRIKPGFFNPPGGRPVFVPGFNWLQVLVAGMRGAPTLAHMRWWTTRGAATSDKRSEEKEVLRYVANLWGANVLHIWDRGFASHPWIQYVLTYPIRFIVRWRKDFKLVDAQENLRPAWQITRGKRSWGHKMIYDCKRRCYRKTGVLAMPVWLADVLTPFWLVVSRPGNGLTPWYLLTTTPIHSIEDAWQIVFAYNRRWQIEMSIRFTKSELAFESPRLRKWHARHKLMLLAALLYSFLLSLLSDGWGTIVSWLFRLWCHRTGSWHKRSAVPLYRLRLALSRLFLYLKQFTPDLLNPG